MANLSKTKTLFAWTSPRTIEKIIPEIDLLIRKFDGQVWSGNVSLQAAFYKALVNSDFFEGQRQNNNPEFAARDRITRAPKALGFVDLKPRIKLTPVGEALLSGIRIHEVIAKQLFKFQLPSPYHKISLDKGFNVRPYLELLRLTKKLGRLSKMEIAIFFVQITHHEKFDSVVAAIRKFREDAKTHTRARKTFVDKVFTEEIRRIYAEEININSLKTRESTDTSLPRFIRTKKANHVDYADAFIRYLRATQLVTFDRKTFRMIISPSRVEEVDYILKTVDRNALVYNADADYKKYLFDPSSLLLLADNRRYLENRLEQLQVKFPTKQSIASLKDLIEATEGKLISASIEKTEISLKNYKEFDDIVKVFDKILKKEVPDPSLYLEWNVWRSFVMINYAESVNGNFKIDLDGVPLSTALGNVADIEIQYEGFKMLVEVTMSVGQRQYEMENESVARHYGKTQNASDEPVYCIFIAPKINEATLAYFYDKNIKAPKFYGGKTRIVPMSIDQFIMFVTQAKARKFKKPAVLKAYLDSLIDINRSVDDEMIWFREINISISTWPN